MMMSAQVPAIESRAALWECLGRVEGVVERHAAGLRRVMGTRCPLTEWSCDNGDKDHEYQQTARQAASELWLSLVVD